jgi:small subunit ribosomal protein S16
MLVIRMQRTGRKGHAMFRMVVQDSRQTPTSGKVVALVGSYDPHTKVATLNKEKISTFLSHGAQPSERVARLLKTEKVKLPEWVKLPEVKKSTVRNPEKMRKNQPKPEVTKEEKPAEESKVEEVVAASVESEAAADSVEVVEEASEVEPAKPESESETQDKPEE